MKIAVLSYSGNVGKTTVARDLFALRMPDHDLITIESINRDGKEAKIIKGEQGEQLFVELLVNDNLILDIGSSNVEQFFNSAIAEPELLTAIDIFVIPVTPEKKQQADTIRIASELIHANVDPGQIHIIFNRVNPNSIIDEVFGGLCKSLDQIGVSYDFNHSILQHNIYTQKSTLSDLLSDEDFLAAMSKAKENGDNQAARSAAENYARQKKVKMLDSSYQEIFEAIL